MIQAGEIHFRVALDTASSDLWIVSSECETEQCKRVPRYPLPYQSATFVSVEANSTVFNASYADGTSKSVSLWARQDVWLTGTCLVYS